MSPSVTANAVVPMYIPMVLPPIRLSFFISDKEATPVIKDESTRGIAISFKRLIKIVPKGAIQSDVKLPQPELVAMIP